MTKKKYKVLDSRTGYSVGEVIELSDDELNKTPFNVHLMYVEPVKKPSIKVKGDKKW